MFYFAASLLCVFIVDGCNIKEDRRQCPCMLGIDMSDVRIGEGDYLEMYITSMTDLLHSERLDAASLTDELLVDVPRTSLRLMAWCGGEGMTGPDGLVIPMGSQCPRVYMYVTDIDAVAEVCRDTLKMKKNHCVISFSVREDVVDVAGVAVRGSVCGYDASGDPVEGDFLSYASSRDSFPYVVVPRQSGGEMSLEVEYGNGKVFTFPLSEYIYATGYDWDAPDLCDLIVNIDLVHTEISLEIQGWDEEFFFDVVL